MYVISDRGMLYKNQGLKSIQKLLKEQTAHFKMTFIA